jgi:hypothetical protein
MAVVAVVALSLVSSALAAPQNYGDLTTGFSSELGAAVPVALAALGLFIGIILAIKVARRILRA